MLSLKTELRPETFSEVPRLKVGIMSDTHDNLPLIDKAVQRLNLENADLVLHAGDYIAPFVIPRFKPLKARMIGVFGNNDGDHELMRKRLGDAPNMEIRGFFAQIMVDKLRIAMVHGSDVELLNALVDCAGFDVVVHGHTHGAQITRKGRTLQISPGEVCGYLTGKSTIALFDTKRKLATILEL